MSKRFDFLCMCGALGIEKRAAMKFLDSKKKKKGCSKKASLAPGMSYEQMLASITGDHGWTKQK